MDNIVWRDHVAPMKLASGWCTGSDAIEGLAVAACSEHRRRQWSSTGRAHQGGNMKPAVSGPAAHSTRCTQLITNVNSLVGWMRYKGRAAREQEVWNSTVGQQRPLSPPTFENLLKRHLRTYLKFYSLGNVVVTSEWSTVSKTKTDMDIHCTMRDELRTAEWDCETCAWNTLAVGIHVCFSSLSNSFTELITFSRRTRCERNVQSWCRNNEDEVEAD